MVKTTVKRTALIIASILCMAVIFAFSAERGEKSTETSDSVTENVLSVVVKDYDSLSCEERGRIASACTIVVRKSAHFGVYLALGVLVSLTFDSFGADARRSFIFAMAVCVLYAASDELHQYFVPGRACRLLDVLIDSAGAAVGAGAAAAVLSFFKNKNKQNAMKGGTQKNARQD